MIDYSQYINVGGEIQTKDQKTKFKDPTELAGHMGIKADDIQWGQIQPAGSAYTKNKSYDPNDTASNRYIPTAGLIQPTTPTGASQTQPVGAQTTPEGIKAVFGEGWQSSSIFKERGLLEKGIEGAVRIKGGEDVFTIGKGGGWVESPEDYEKLFGTREQAGIVGEISPEEAKLLGIRPEGVTARKAEIAKDKEMKKLFDMAQQAGLSYEETMNLVNAQYPTDTAGIREELGIPDVVDTLFQMPSQSIQELYQEGYDKSELPNLKDKIKDIDDGIKKARDDLATATGQINENPWISESSRVGKMRTLNERAEETIFNLEKQRTSYLDLYDKGLDELEGVMLRSSQQYERQRTLHADQLNYLLGEAERRSTEAREEKMSEHLRYMPDWLKERADTLEEEKKYERGREDILSFSEKVELFEKGYTIDNEGNISADISGASVEDIMNAIKQVESNGNYEASGGSGEYGAYQFMPKTWESWSSQYSQEVLGTGPMSLEMTPENQDAVAKWKIEKLVNQGYNPQQIASIWNSGKPDWKGNIGEKTLPDGTVIKWNVPGYVSKIEKALSGTMKGSGKGLITDMAKNIIDGFGKLSNIKGEEKRELVNQEIRRLREEGYKPEWQEKRMSDMQLKTVSDFDNEAQSWSRVKEIAEALKDKFGPTTISAYDGSMTALFRQYSKDPEFSALYAEIEKAFQVFRIRVTGVQASDKELARIRPLLPALKERPSVFFEKLDKTVKGLERARNIYLETLEKGGIDVSQFGGADGLSDEEAYQIYLQEMGQ